MSGGDAGALEISTLEALSEIEAEAWDALAGDDNPFVEHAFLDSLEAAGCVGSEAGWMPAHVVVWRRDGEGEKTLVGATPLYVKDNSYGEYIFDWGWANACQRAGIPYYPKVVSAVPFTPATGPRLLVHPEAEASTVRAALAQGARAVADAVDASSIHWLFVEPDEVEALTTLGFRPRSSFQFHWIDRGFGDFDGYLAALTTKRRKEVRRERRQAAASGLTLDVERMADLTDDDLDALYACYRSTIDDHWAIPYLNRDWYGQLRERLGQRAWVATGRRADGALVTGALAFHKGAHLYGRYWGALEDHRAVHFELAYYRLIDLALRLGCTRFEAGAQGVQKLQRGFLPTPCHSAHWLAHPGLDRAVADFLDQEAVHVRREIAHHLEHSPFAEDRACGS